MWLCKTTKESGTHIQALFKPRALYGVTINNDDSTIVDLTNYIFELIDETTKRRIEIGLDNSGTVVHENYFNFPATASTIGSTNINIQIPDIVYSSKQVAFNPYTQDERMRIRITFSNDLDTGGAEAFLGESKTYVFNMYWKATTTSSRFIKNPYILYSAKIFCTDQEVNPRLNQPYTTNQNITENPYSKQPSYITI